MRLILIAVTVIVVSSWFSNTTYSIQIEEKWWQTQFERGIALLNRGELREAESQFNQILSRDKKVTEAHYGLGLVYHTRTPGCTKAIDYMEKTIIIKNLKKELTMFKIDENV